MTITTSAQSSVVLESTQLKKGDTCIFYGYLNGNITRGDTILIQTAGRLELSSKTPLPQGQYILQTPKQIYNGMIELLIEKSNSNVLKISHDSLYNSISFKDNPVNGVYSAYLGSVRATENQIQKLYAKVNLTTPLENREKISREIKEPQKRLYDLESSIIKRYPNTLLSAIVSCNNLPLMSGSILDNYMSDSNSALYKQTTKFLRDNYFKGVDFHSDVLLNTSLVPFKIKKYISLFDKNDPELDDVVKELLQKSAVNPLMYQVVSDALYTIFHQSLYTNNNENIMIDILKNAKQQSFVPDWKKQSITQQILIYQKNKVGTQAANLNLKDFGDKEYLLNNVKSKYTILYFYDPECSNCSEITPKMKGWFYVDGPKNATILAIYINQDEQEWSNYIRENTYPPRWINLWDKNESDKMREKYWIESLPAIYVLDENKKVILKNVNFKQLIKYFSK
ncbi:thioredoxin-like domain-containing protein [Flavobacterium sp. CFBP9031]|uniref:thioredoxin family protein n=1 Tax=Flavobacterium sp. CFBP9031 TaxID=3096538 RepID=UPI002A69E767|nr:thioredoxin-like domain-containing protein [Flavobacterium sp. CFBP9031]MDY0989467.1 thioredoxin-like domain-containing protein [Flavobacterium sp. CFBP9031]